MRRSFTGVARYWIDTRVVMAVALAICSLPSVAASEVQSLSDGQFRYTKPWAITTVEQGEVHVGYHSEDGNVYFSGQDTPISLSLGENKRASSGMALATQGRYVHAIWREKTNAKKLLYVRSEDAGKTFSKPVLLGTDSQPLTRIKLEARDQWVFATWLGERVVAGQEGYVGKGKKGKKSRNKSYNLYLKYSKDNGKTFSETHRVVPGIYPAIEVSADAAYVFSWASLDDKPPHTLVRRFDLKTEAWGPVVKITEVPQSSALFQSLLSGDRLFLFWQSLGGKPENFQLEGAYSSDEGKNWTKFTFPSLKGMDFSKIVPAHDDAGHVYLFASGSRRLIEEHDKENVYFLRSADNGSTWADPQVLRHHPYKNVTKARFPSIAVNNNGDVAVGWEDWKNIVPNFFVNISRDFGNTWLDQDLPIDTPNEKNLGTDGRINTMFFSDGILNIIALPYVDDELRRRSLVRYRLDNAFFKPREDEQVSLFDRISEYWNEALERLSGDSGNDRKAEKVLRDRVNEYWQAFVDGNYEVAYPLIDPYFRARNSKYQYLAKRGTIKYHSYQIGNIRIQGNIAKVVVNSEYSIPQIRDSDKVFSKPPTKQNFLTTWVFIRGEWYSEYLEESSGFYYTKYR